MTRPIGTLNLTNLRNGTIVQQAEDNIDMGDHPSCAGEPPTVRDKCIEGVSSIAKAPAITTHPPDPTHLDMPEG